MTLKRWLHYARPYARYFVIGPLCMIVEVLGEILLPSLYGSIVNVGIAEQNVWYIAGVCGLMILTAVLMMTGGVGGAYFASKASVNYAADLRRDVYSKIQKFSFANIDRFSTGSLVTRLTNDVTQIMNMINMLMRMCLRSPGMLIGALIMTIAMNPSLAVVLGGLDPAAGGDHRDGRAHGLPAVYADAGEDGWPEQQDPGGPDERARHQVVRARGL